MSDLDRILKLASHGTNKAQGQAPAERELKEPIATEDEARPYQGTAEPRLTHRGEKYYDHPSTKNVPTGEPGSKAKTYSGRSGNAGHGINPDAGDPYADPDYVEVGSKAKTYSGRDGNAGHGINPDAGDLYAEPVFRDAIMRIADKMARQKNLDTISKNYDDRIQRLSRAEAVEEAVGEFAEPIYDLIDMHFEGDCQPVFDDLVRFLSGDQIKEFVDDFRRHHELPMGDEETDESVEPTEPSTEEGNEFSGALAKAKKDGKDEFEVDGKKYKVKEEELNELNVPNDKEEVKSRIEKLMKMAADARDAGDSNKAYSIERSSEMAALQNKLSKLGGDDNWVTPEGGPLSYKKVGEYTYIVKDENGKEHKAEMGAMGDEQDNYSGDEIEQTMDQEGLAMLIRQAEMGAPVEEGKYGKKKKYNEAEEDTAEEISEAPTMDTTQLITLLKNAGLSEEAIDKKLNEWANTPAGAAEEEATSHGEPYENFAQSVNLSLKRYLDAEDMKVGLKEHKVEDIKEAYKKSKEK